MSFLDIVSKFNQQAVDHTQSQALNPFSGQFDQSRSPSPRFSREEYGKPVAGSKTDLRGRKAKTHICREILELCTVIHDVGTYNSSKKTPDNDSSSEFDDGTIIVTFGEIFQIYTKISDKVVGLLIAAKRRGFVFFDREILYQRRNDDVLIALIKPIEEINRILKAEIEEANAPAPPCQPTTQVTSDEANLKRPVAKKPTGFSNGDASGGGGSVVKESIKVNGTTTDGNELSSSSSSDVPPTAQVVVVEITDACDSTTNDSCGDDGSNEVCGNERLEEEKSANDSGDGQVSCSDSQSADPVSVGEIALDAIEKDVGGVHEIISNAIDSVVKNDVEQEDIEEKTDEPSESALESTEVVLNDENLGDVETQSADKGEEQIEKAVSVESVENSNEAEKTVEVELDEHKLDNDINSDEAKENRIDIENVSNDSENKHDSNVHSLNDCEIVEDEHDSSVVPSLNDCENMESRVETNCESEKNEDNGDESNLDDKNCSDGNLTLNVYEVVNKENVEQEDRNNVEQS